MELRHNAIKQYLAMGETNLKCSEIDSSQLQQDAAKAERPSASLESVTAV
jgi:hypothetical protein